MDLDSELIILEVQKYSCLYDTKSKDYKDREKKRESWLLVTEAVLGEKWAELDEENKSIIVGKEIQKRWKSMKDSYMKSLKALEGRSGDPAKPGKNYVFHKQMAFLQSVFQLRETSGTMNTPSSAETVRGEPSPQPILKTTATPRLPRTRKSDHFEQEIVNVLKENLVQSTPQMPDADEMFFLSQVPVVKKMKPCDKLEFQVKFMQLLQSYASPTPSPPPTLHYSISPSTSNQHPTSVHNSSLPSLPSPCNQTNSEPSPARTYEASDDDSLISFSSL